MRKLLLSLLLMMTIFLLVIYLIAMDPFWEDLRTEILSNYTIWHYVEKVSKFFGPIASFLLFLSSILMFKAPESVLRGWLYRRCSEAFCRRVQYYFSVMLIILVIIILIIPPSELLVGLLGIVWSVTSFLIVLEITMEITKLRIQGTHITLIEILGILFALINSFAFIIASLILIVGF